MGVSLRPGDVVAGKYRIERQIGSGGMGVVVAATHLQLDQPVALKFLLEGENIERHVATERFLREARATFRLRSEHTVRVMDVGTLPTGEPFMVMELLEGRDFKQLLQERGPLPPAEAVLYLVQACAALQEAHAFGIVHRDFKARNVFVTARVDGTPCVKVLDFGISKMESGGDVAPLTQAGMGMGSPRYMAPEQWTSASTVDARADIYAAGAVLYELLTGQIPLAGLPLVEVIKRIRAGAVPSPKEIRPDLPDVLCRVVMRALRPRPEERFASASEFAQALRQAMPESTGDHAPARKPMGATLPTAVVNRDVLLARAAIDAHLNAPPSSVAPTADERPAFGAPLPEVGGEEEGDELATIVTRSPMDASPYDDAPAQHATLQVAEAPPEIQALRRVAATAASAVPVPPTIPMAFTPMGLPAPPPPPSQRTLDNPGNVQAPRFTPPGSAPPLEPPRKGMPAWFFWSFLVITFCAAGGLAAALLMRVLR